MSYSPRPPAGFKVPKGVSNFRTINTFQIADEAVSNRLMRSLTRKNLSKLSARAYAYRSDLNAHDAISYIQTEFRREHRLFIAEYDFSSFFDSISHDHLFETIERLELIITPLERKVLESFLLAPEPYLSILQKDEPKKPRPRGLPQGTSISLLLANLAASELDRRLERLGVGFVRYADDTLIWSADYGRIGAAVDILHEAAQGIGSNLNPEKSRGVRLLVQDETKYVEMEFTKTIDFLGHSLSLRETRMKQAVVAKIKRRIGTLIYTNLLLEPLAKTQDPTRLLVTDSDYVALIWQLRRYLYGALNEKDLRKLSRGPIPPMSFQGVMSFFPLINDVEELTKLDAWIATQVWLALRKRTASLESQGLPTPAPQKFLKKELIAFQFRSKKSGENVDARMPSVRLISEVIRAAVSIYGLRVTKGQNQVYSYNS
ncbi:reverse transcriptase domain-containing protein [Rathayibacter sp. AY2B3]|uniref:reverse transcriptase domain-containing protein n=1 Tax=Rathayibacter sp. AY2B3 TaxID=2080569 RepID=UPI001CA526FA|nr:reverse transcriptase domain-containing protein [Rathayibacter sp. AY2B3]